ncbi:hypothetical protein ACMFFK_08185 [Serratia marcescens]|uniref:hypothetical protein n=2 Tax=Serratia marcescens TaxID=615 RepID=UPI001056F0F2|nr:hypothetical protein [Serratia marcescens]MBN5328105.1 hypothetical protein [Serratia marcescens]MBN5351803.1 hypothetical protein [Serratia marcescens]MCX2177981.1 hypothetical protein [Serratia marcescens]QLJ60403.1 hypothetical protein HP475_10945 [Serratia marcescens]WAZ05122.1 hypothetical protein O3T12_18235 [Serratia marcescens]
MMEKLRLVRTAQQLKSGGQNIQDNELSLSISKLPPTDKLNLTALVPVVNEGVTEAATIQDIVDLLDGGAPGDIKLDPSANNLLSNSNAGLMLDRYKAPCVGITGTYVSTSAGPDFTKDNAFSETGGIWRVKNTLMLSRVPSTANGAVIVDITLGKIPCDSSGIPLQYTLSVGTTSKKVSGVWRQHSVMILAIFGAPIKLMDVVSGVLEDYKEGVAWGVSVKYTFGDMAPSVP